MLMAVLMQRLVSMVMAMLILTVTKKLL